jgi:hypothetical protein
MMRATDETPSESRGTTGSKRLGMKMADRASVRRARRAAEWFIAIGVVIILGAAEGLMWRDRGMSFRAAVTRIRRAS